MRKPQVTRTITTTEANVMCLDVMTGEPCNKIFTAPRTYKDEDKLLKYLKATEDTEEVKLVHIVDMQVKETFYGMEEAEFIKHATVLPARQASK